MPDAVNLADKPVVNDDDTPGSAHNMPQKVANVISYSALSNMHAQLGHASAEAMLRLLEGGILPAGVDSITRADIKRVISNCTICERFGSKPLRPRAAIQSDVKFNESVYIDVFYIDGHPVLSAVCAGTRYTAAGLTVSKSTADLWDTLQRIWIPPLAGCPLNIRLDSASEHRSDEMSGVASGCGVELQFSPVEVHWYLGSGERVHSLIRNVYHKAHMHAPYLALDTKLAWSVFALNATPQRYCTAASPLVFGTLPRLPVSGLNQAAALRNDCQLTVMLIAREDAERQNILRRLSEVKRRNSPSDKTISHGDLCYVYRDKGDYKGTNAGYTGLYTFIGRRDKRPTCWMYLQQRVFISR
jgi:hypothetical protein